MIKQLVQHYEQQGRNGRPVADHQDSMTVNFSLSLIQIMDIDEKNQVLKINVWYHYVSFCTCNLQTEKITNERLFYYMFIVSKICHSTYLELRRISSVRHVLTVEATKTLVRSQVLSSID